VIARSEPEPRVAVDQARAASRNRDVRHQGRRETGSHGGTLDCRDDGLRAVNDVVAEVAKLSQRFGLQVVVLSQPLDHPEVAPGAERLAGSADDRDVRFGVAVHVQPDAGELAVGFPWQRVELLGAIVGDSQTPLVRAVEGEILVGSKVGTHEAFRRSGWETCRDAAERAPARRVGEVAGSSATSSTTRFAPASPRASPALSRNFASTCSRASGLSGCPALTSIRSTIVRPSTSRASTQPGNVRGNGVSPSAAIR